MSTLRSHVEGCCSRMHRVGREHWCSVGLMEESVFMRTTSRQSAHRMKRVLEAKLPVPVHAQATLMPLHLHPLRGGVLGCVWWIVGLNEGKIVAQRSPSHASSTVLLETRHCRVQSLPRRYRCNWPRFSGSEVARGCRIEKVPFIIEAFPEFPAESFCDSC